MKRAALRGAEGVEDDEGVGGAGRQDKARDGCEGEEVFGDVDVLRQRLRDDGYGAADGAGLAVERDEDGARRVDGREGPRAVLCGDGSGEAEPGGRGDGVATLLLCRLDDATDERQVPRVGHGGEAEPAVGLEAEVGGVGEVEPAVGGHALAERGGIEQRSGSGRVGVAGAVSGAVG